MAGPGRHIFGSNPQEDTVFRAPSARKPTWWPPTLAGWPPGPGQPSCYEPRSGQAIGRIPMTDDHFVSSWRLLAPIERVWDEIFHTERWPSW
jgi:hypothetical protein